MSAKKTRPPMDADLLVIISHCLGFEPAYTEALIEVFAETLPPPEDGCWDRHDILTDAVPVAKDMRLPYDPKHQQHPHDIARVLRCTLPIHSDQSGCEDETVVNRMLYPLFLTKIRTAFATLPYEQALQQTKESMIETNHYFGSPDRATREAHLREALDVLEWFACTEGLHGEDGTVDVETAAMRAFMKGVQ